MQQMEVVLEAKKTLARYCQLVHQRGLVSACGGNMSLRIQQDLYLLTPSGFALDEVSAQDCVLVDDQGVSTEMGGLKPTSETQLHIGIYQRRPEVNAVLHTHSPAATSYAYCGKTIQPVNPESMMCLPQLPIVPYYQYGSQELADAVAETIGHNSALLLAKHGVVTVGKTIREALHIAELVEETALMNIYVKMIGGND